MNKSVVTLLIVCGVFAGTARQASAQGATWADRGYINVGWGVESGSSAMTDSRTGTIYEETATVTTSSTFSSGSLFDVGVGLRVFRNLTFGVSYHQEQNDTEGRLTGSIPSPVVFNRPRTLDQAVPGLERKEKAVHLQIGWVVPISEKFDVLVYGGPSFFRLEQDVVSDLTFGEQGNNTVIATAQHRDAQEEPDRLQRRRGRDLHRLAERQRSRRRGRLRALHAGVDGSRHADDLPADRRRRRCSSVSARVCASNIAEVPMARSGAVATRGVDRGAPDSHFTVAVSRHRGSHQRRYAPYRRAPFNLDPPRARGRGGCQSPRCVRLRPRRILAASRHAPHLAAVPAW